MKRQEEKRKKQEEEEEERVREEVAAENWRRWEEFQMLAEENELFGRWWWGEGMRWWIRM